MKKGILRMIGSDMYVDWAIDLSAACIVALILMFVGYNVYRNTNADISTSSAKAITHKPSFDEKMLGDVLKDYDSRATESTRLRVGYYGPGDPSR